MMISEPMKFGVYRKVQASGRGKGTGVGQLYQFVTLARDHYGKGPDLVAYTPLRIEPEWAGRYGWAIADPERH